MDKDARESARDQKIKNSIRDKFESELNKHGYAFQYSVIKRFEDLQKERYTFWNPVGPEFPVEVAGQASHIDFVLRTVKDYGDQRFLVAECKRVDPAKGYWCFAKSPHTWLGVHRDETIFEQVKYNLSPHGYYISTTHLDLFQDVFHIRTEVKGGDRGDGTGGSSKSVINDAVSQVLKGTSGLINYLCTDQTHIVQLKPDINHIFIPVIFTTARIFVTEADLAQADLFTGYLEKNSLKIEEKDWVWLNENRSPNLSHGRRIGHRENINIHFEDFTRSVAIVSPSGIDSFFHYI